MSKKVAKVVDLGKIVDRMPCVRSVGSWFSGKPAKKADTFYKRPELKDVNEACLVIKSFIKTIDEFIPVGEEDTKRLLDTCKQVKKIGKLTGFDVSTNVESGTPTILMTLFDNIISVSNEKKSISDLIGMEDESLLGKIFGDLRVGDLLINGYIGGKITKKITKKKIDKLLGEMGALVGEGILSINDVIEAVGDYKINDFITAYSADRKKSTTDTDTEVSDGEFTEGDDEPPINETIVELPVVEVVKPAKAKKKVFH